MTGDVLGQALAVIAVAMVALGPYVRIAVDGIKATKRIRQGYAGVVALAVGVVVGAVIGCLAWIDGASARWLLVGAVAGFFGGVAAIQAEHAAVGRQVLAGVHPGQQTVVRVAQARTEPATASNAVPLDLKG